VGFPAKDTWNSCSADESRVLFWKASDLGCFGFICAKKKKKQTKRVQTRMDYS
jgi:hypothetical protein